MNGKQIGILVGTVLPVLTAAAGYHTWQAGEEDKKVEAVEAYAAERSYELELQLIEAQLKHLRSVAERRPLTADESDELELLRQKRLILLEEMKKRGR